MVSLARPRTQGTDDGIVEIDPARVSVFDGGSPEERLKAIMRTAQLVPTILKSQSTTAQIDGNKYITLDGWCALASIHNLTPTIIKIDEIKEGVFRAECVVLFCGTELIRVFSECSMDERGKRDRYAAVSMAQSRAISKGLRHVLAPAVALAEGQDGYKLTPADEVPVDGFGQQQPPRPQRARPRPAQQQPKPAAPKQTLVSVLDGIAEAQKWDSAGDMADWRQIALENARILSRTKRQSEVLHAAGQAQAWNDLADRLGAMFGAREDALGAEADAAPAVDRSTGEIIDEVDEEIAGQEFPDHTEGV